MAKYKYIGYYNDSEDLIELVNEDIEGIVDYNKNDYGKFYKATSDCGVRYSWEQLSRHNHKGTEKDKYVAVIFVEDKENPTQDDFIDLYMRVSK